MRQEKEMLAQILNWAENHEQIRAVILTSSRTNPSAQKDLFSDYDPILVVSDTTMFNKDNAWLQHFGSILASFQSESTWDEYDGLKDSAHLVIYDDGVKIDFIIWSIELLLRIAQEPALPEFLDLGYRVLLDKEGLTANLRKPTHLAYITARPTEKEYLAQVEEFWFDTTYVAKSLWRDELYFAKFMIDNVMRFGYLQKVIEWYIGAQNDWTVNSGKRGRWFKRYLDPKTWAELEATFIGPNIEDNWDALFTMMDLFRRLAMEVGNNLGYEYPCNLDRRLTDYLLKVRALDSDAVDFTVAPES